MLRYTSDKHTNENTRSNPNSKVESYGKRKVHLEDTDQILSQIKKFRISSSPGELRLQKDIKEVNHLTHIEIIDTDSPSIIMIRFKNNDQKNLLHLFEITISKYYPHTCPSIKCLDFQHYITDTQSPTNNVLVHSHPHISTIDGTVSHPCFGDNWSPLYSLSTIIEILERIRSECILHLSEVNTSHIHVNGTIYKTIIQNTCTHNSTNIMKSSSYEKSWIMSLDKITDYSMDTVNTQLSDPTSDLYTSTNLHSNDYFNQTYNNPYSSNDIYNNNHENNINNMEQSNIIMADDHRHSDNNSNNIYGGREDKNDSSDNSTTDKDYSNKSLDDNDDNNDFIVDNEEDEQDGGGDI